MSAARSCEASPSGIWGCFVGLIETLSGAAVPNRIGFWCNVYDSYNKDPRKFSWVTVIGNDLGPYSFLGLGFSMVLQIRYTTAWARA